MNAIAPAPTMLGNELTLSERLVLRAAGRFKQLERVTSGGVCAVNELGKAQLPRFPLRTINALERSGYLARQGKAWLLTCDGVTVAGQL